MKDPAAITALNHLGSFKKHFVMCLKLKKKLCLVKEKFWLRRSFPTN